MEIWRKYAVDALGDARFPSGKGRASAGRSCEELDAFLLWNPRKRDYYLTAVLTGLRSKELWLIERRDFDLERGMWTCRAEMDRMGVQHRLPILPDLLPVLKRGYEGKAATEKLFPKQPQPVTFSGHLRKAGITKVSEDGPWLTFHSLRSTFCTLLADKLPLKVVQWLMRHASLQQSADLYLRFDLDSMLEQSC